MARDKPITHPGQGSTQTEPNLQRHPYSTLTKYPTYIYNQRRHRTLHRTTTFVHPRQPPPTLSVSSQVLSLISPTPPSLYSTAQSQHGRQSAIRLDTGRGSGSHPIFWPRAPPPLWQRRPGLSTPPVRPKHPYGDRGSLLSQPTPTQLHLFPPADIAGFGVGLAVEIFLHILWCRANVGHAPSLLTLTPKWVIGPHTHHLTFP